MVLGKDLGSRDSGVGTRESGLGMDLPSMHGAHSLASSTA